MDVNMDVNQVDKHGISPLLCAATHGQTFLVHILLQDKTIDVNQVDKKGNTPLLLASGNGHYAVVQLLLQHPTIKINQMNLKGKNPLIAASEEGQYTVIQLLLQHNNINVDPHYGNRSLLQYIITRSNCSIIRYNSAIMDLFLQHPNIQVDPNNETGDTPLIIAARHARHNTVEHLMPFIVNVDQVNQDGNTSLIEASRHYHSVNDVKILLQSNANVNHVNFNGDTPLTLAASHASVTLVNHLLHCKADINYANLNGDTPLTLAASRSDGRYANGDVFNHLLYCNADINHINNKGETSLMLASYCNNTAPNVEILLQCQGIKIPNINNILFVYTPGIKLPNHHVSGYAQILYLLFYPKITNNPNHGNTEKYNKIKAYFHSLKLKIAQHSGLYDDLANIIYEFAHPTYAHMLYLMDEWLSDSDREEY